MEGNRGGGRGRGRGGNQGGGGGGRGGGGEHRGGGGGGRGGGEGGGYRGGRGGGGYQGGSDRGGGGYHGGSDRGGGGGSDRGGRGRGGRGGPRGGGGGFGGPREGSDGVAAVTEAFRRSNITSTREYIDMNVAKDILTTRPAQIASKRGSTGTPLNMTANYFGVQTKKDWEIFQYRVDFAPDIPDTRIRKALLNRVKAQVGGNCFDGTMMFKVQRLKIANNEITTKLDSSDEKIRILFKEVGLLSRTDQRFLQIYNIIMNRIMVGLQLTQMGRNFYDSHAAINLNQHNIQLWPGYSTSIRQHENSLLMNVDVGFKFIRSEFVYDLFGRNRSDRNRMTASCVGQVVLTEYNNKTYRVDGVDFSQSPKSTFTSGDKQVSYVEYYQKRWNIKIKDENQPMLVSKTKARERRGGAPEEIYLVPELCKLTGMTDEMRSNFTAMKDVSQYTRVDPRGRQDKLRLFRDRMEKSAASLASMREFGMELDKDIVRIQGRILNGEKILFKNQKEFFSPKADWTGALANHPVYSPGSTLDNWFVITPRFCAKETRFFVEQLAKASRGLGISLNQPNYIELEDDRPASYVRTLEEVCAKDPQLLMCVVSNDSAERYSAIKKTLSVHRSVLSQVMLKRTVCNPNPARLLSVATKVVIQIHTKRGFAPWKVVMPLSKTMVIGFDVSRDTRDRGRDFAAFVASMDQRSSDVYYSCAEAHRTNEELSNSFGQMTLKAIQCYQKVHKELPERIIIYRDGVGDGQLQFVVDHELRQLQQSLNELYGEQKVKLAFIVVTKRISARLFNGSINVPAGTVVDDVITLPERYDFFLVAQNVNQGTATPTNYNVIYDSLGLSPDKLQMLTYKLCHLYYNWSGTVRVPNVCQYAHKLSLLVGQYFHAPPNEQLSNKLHFL